MKKLLSMFLLCFAFLLISNSFIFASADLKDVTPGKWTMDLNAAKKMAAEKKMSILLNFSGSDWCVWCQLMEKNVFSTDEWKNYAKENVLMVMLDFPQDKSLVPQEFVVRNNQLKEFFKIEGFPTFILIDDDGQTVLGKLGAGKEKTPASFIEEIKIISRYRKSEIEKYTSTLSPEEKQTYLNIIDQIIKLNLETKDLSDKVALLNQSLEKNQQQRFALKEKAVQFRVSKLNPEEQQKYNDLRLEFMKVNKEMTVWIQTNPERNDANMKKYQDLNLKLQAIGQKLSKF